MRYRQHCPVASGAEVIGQSWTVLVVRELLHGSTTASQIALGVPEMSPALLTKRLKQLVEAGVVVRSATGGRTRFDLTPAGRELALVLERLGQWSRRWLPRPGVPI
ncbi:helix-turn-helix transcriptional regulator [Amycolatopsis sp. OK19-0408]|uniref:Helix-turn-helix transcriptional regulator n=1 Tax=Amycolatopsis iheyensis TaxID=2945988 RepID=A0A9X2SRQ8_9PSEU|nr:helix-turn-helix domain-containing protein [Amycolatopsis iheyensis]MCR6490540.1 helix-turn-helix transcriptional regulator [Amycolatopsis iheyensis]